MFYHIQDYDRISFAQTLVQSQDRYDSICNLTLQILVIVIFERLAPLLGFDVRPAFFNILVSLTQVSKEVLCPKKLTDGSHSSMM